MKLITIVPVIALILASCNQQKYKPVATKPVDSVKMLEQSDVTNNNNTADSSGGYPHPSQPKSEPANSTSNVYTFDHMTAKPWTYYKRWENQWHEMTMNDNGWAEEMKYWSGLEQIQDINITCNLNDADLAVTSGSGTEHYPLKRKDANHYVRKTELFEIVMETSSLTACTVTFINTNDAAMVSNRSITIDPNLH